MIRDTQFFMDLNNDITKMNADLILKLNNININEDAATSGDDGADFLPSFQISHKLLMM